MPDSMPPPPPRLPGKPTTASHKSQSQSQSQSSPSLRPPASASVSASASASDETSVVHQMRRIIHQHLRKSRKQKDIYHVLMKGVNDEMEGYKFAIQEINLLIRFSSNPVRFSLAASLAFLYESRLSERRRHITAAKTKAEISIHFAEQATKMLGHVVYGETNKMERLDELLLNAEDDFSSIAMAVELENFSFLSHPLIINYVKRRWVGDADKIGRYGFQFIEVNTLIESVKNSYDMSIGSTQQQQSSFVILNSMRAFSNQIISNFDETIVGMLDPMVLINSPSTRFKVEFVFFGCRVAVQQFVLSYEEYAPGNQVLGSFGPLDMVHFGIGIGFLMAEIAEVQKAYRWGSIHIDRYWGDGWNQMDWCIQIVFFSFWALKIVSQYYDTNSDYDEAALYHGYSLDVLGINSIVLWIRMLEVSERARPCGRREIEPLLNTYFARRSTSQFSRPSDLWCGSWD